jgi:hypothetical protein
MTDKTFQLYSHLTKEQADVMLAILVHLHGDNGVVTVTKEEFESIPDVSRLTIEVSEDTGLVILKLKEEHDHE